MWTRTWGSRFCLGLLVGVGLVSCGGSGGGGEADNDQGIVFRAAGFVRGLESIDENEIRCVEPNVQNAIIDSSFVLDLDRIDFFPDRNDPFGDPCGGYIALENNLTFMDLNVQEVVVRYEVPGAAIAIPLHSITFSTRIRSADSQEETASGRANLVYSQLVGEMLPSRIITFLNQNRNLLPAPPYALNAFFEAKAQADNGARYTSNEIGYQFEITS